MAVQKAVTRVLTSHHDTEALATLLRGRAYPQTVTIRSGKPRSGEQNRLLRKWCVEVSEQMGDRTAEEVRGHAKLHFGVVILKRDLPDYAEKYDRLIRPHSYAEKLEMMQEPLDFPVTRLMTTKQETEFLNAVAVHWAAQGVILTIPEERR